MGMSEGVCIKNSDDMNWIIRTMELFGNSVGIIAEGLQRYLPRVSEGWWALTLSVALIMLVYNWNLCRGGQRKASAAIGQVTATVYFLCVMVITFGTRLPDPHIQYQLIPFLSHRLALQGDRNEQFQILCNVLLFVPFGILWPILKNGKKDTIWGVLQAAFLFTFCIEFLQLVTRIGCFEIDDMINNTLGAVVGYLMYRIIDRLGRLCQKVLTEKKMKC